MPAKQLSFNDEARQAMGRGVSIVGTAVATTLGPKDAMLLFNPHQVQLLQKMV